MNFFLKHSVNKSRNKKCLYVYNKHFTFWVYWKNTRRIVDKAIVPKTRRIRKCPRRKTNLYFGYWVHLNASTLRCGRGHFPTYGTRWWSKFRVMSEVGYCEKHMLYTYHKHKYFTFMENLNVNHFERHCALIFGLSDEINSH